MSKSALLPIEKKVKEALRRYFPNPRDVHFIVGVSGGIDSVCLLHVFNRLKIKTTVVHVNYGTRGEDSDKDAAFVRKTCDALGVACMMHKVNVQNTNFSNFQAWAREVRYQLFEEVLHNIDADAIAVAHHKDDRIETILQKILRGAGLASWTGMKVWNGKLFRPLLHVSRAEIKNYCEKQSISFRTDESNLNSNYARNFLRNECLPKFESHFPGWRKNVLRAAEQSEVFKSSLRYILDDVAAEKEFGLKRKPFLALPLSLQKALLLFFLKEKISGQSVSFGALSGLSALSELQTGKKIQLTETLSLMRDRTVIKPFFEKQTKLPPKLFRFEELKNPAAYGGLTLQVADFSNPDFGRALYVDAEKLEWPFKVRRWSHGDKIQPLGMKGHQTVADHLTNRKVSAADKKKTMVIETFEETIAAVIFPSVENRESGGTISEKYKCDSSTKKTLIIKF